MQKKLIVLRHKSLLTHHKAERIIVDYGTIHNSLHDTFPDVFQIILQSEQLIL